MGNATNLKYHSNFLIEILAIQFLKTQLKNLNKR